MKIGGKTINNWWLVGGAAGLGVVVYEYRKSVGSAASSASSQNATDPVTGLPYSMDNQTDPATGMTYLAEAQQYGSVAAAEAQISGSYGSQANYGTAGASTYYPGGGSSGGVPGSYATNAQWAQAVTAGLTSLGYTSTDVAAALGLYFQGLPLSTLSDGASALSIVQAAVAEYGTPPVGTFQILAPPSTSTPPPNQNPPPSGGGDNDGGGKHGGGGSGGGSVPNLDGKTLSAAQAAATSAGITVASVSRGYEPIPQSQWGQYASYTVASYTQHGSTVDIGLN